MIGCRIDSSALRKKFEQAERTLDASIEKVLVDVANVARKLATQKFQSRTGKLARSIRATRVKSNEYRLEATAPYAGYVEHGTKPHIITPRNGSFLRFVVGGKVVYARRVRHPGTKPTHFMRDTANNITPLFQQLMAEAVKNSFR